MKFFTTSQLVKITNFFLHSYSGQAITLPGDMPALVLSNLLLYRNDFLTFLNKSLFPLKETVEEASFTNCWENFPDKAQGQSWPMILGDVLQLAEKWRHDTLEHGLMARVVSGWQLDSRILGIFSKWNNSVKSSSSAHTMLQNCTEHECAPSDHNCMFTQNKLEKQGLKITRRQLTQGEGS